MLLVNIVQCVNLVFTISIKMCAIIKYNICLVTCERYSYHPMEKLYILLSADLICMFLD